MQLTFVILTWNSERHIKACLLSCLNWCHREEVSARIIVVDNGSSDNTKAILEDSRKSMDKGLELIELPENKGTTYPRNLALKKVRSEFVCILDSDTEFLSGRISDALTILENNKIGIVAPRLLLNDGSVQNSVKMFPTFVQKIGKLRKIFFKMNITDQDFYPDFPFTETREVDSAISACWFFRKDLLEDVGYLDQNIFYSPEDLDYCYRTVLAGKNNLYMPQLTLLHHTQHISHKKPLSIVSIKHFFGLLYYFRKHGGWLRRPDMDH